MKRNKENSVGKTLATGSESSCHRYAYEITLSIKVVKLRLTVADRGFLYKFSLKEVYKGNKN